jgi:hypothetical protein
MIWAGLAAVVLFVIVLVVFSSREEARRAAWFESARTGLGEGFAAFAPLEGTDRKESRGKLEGREAVFSADKATTESRLRVPLPPGVDRGRVFDAIVRDSGGALETGREDVLAGWDDEHGHIVFRAGCQAGGAGTVKVLVEESKAFLARLPAILEEHARNKAESGARIFGDLTGDGGRHKLLGLALALSPEEWELTRARPELIEWERLPPGDDFAPPCELRVRALATEAAYGDAEPRRRLIERVGDAFVGNLPDGSFEGEQPELHGQDAPALGPFPSSVLVLDHIREVVVREEEIERQPYRFIARAVFTPWAVAAVEISAPRDDAQPLLDHVLAGASFEKPEGAP